MARLSIKNFPDPLYETLRELARKEHRSLSQQVVHMLHEAIEQDAPLSILGLKGLGKELWKDIDAADYIRQERDSWDS